MKVVVDINALPCKNGKDCTECAFYSVESICEIPTALQSFPKYEDTRSLGEWIDEGVMADGYSQHAFRCSKCGNHISRIPSNMPNFCENCGAELETVGHWYPDWSESYGKHGFRCSMCERWTSEKEEKCHHCGAKMKEGE